MGGGGEQRADVSAEQPQFAVAHDDVGVLELDTTGADGFDLPAFEDETGFVNLVEGPIELVMDTPSSSNLNGWSL